jgi:hypothetical protein
MDNYQSDRRNKTGVFAMKNKYLDMQQNKDASSSDPSKRARVPSHVAYHMN